jgi:hypothetical protein
MKTEPYFASYSDKYRPVSSDEVTGLMFPVWMLGRIKCGVDMNSAYRLIEQLLGNTKLIDA